VEQRLLFVVFLVPEGEVRSLKRNGSPLLEQFRF